MLEFLFPGEMFVPVPEYGMQLTDDEPECGRLGGERKEAGSLETVFFLISCVKSIMIMHLHLYD